MATSDKETDTTAAAVKLPAAAPVPNARPRTPDAVRAKFRCVSISPDKDSNAHVVLAAVTNGSPENDAFFKYTPSGNMNLAIVAADTASMFVVNGEYMVDITPA